MFQTRSTLRNDIIVMSSPRTTNTPFSGRKLVFSLALSIILLILLFQFLITPSRRTTISTVGQLIVVGTDAVTNDQFVHQEFSHMEEIKVEDEGESQFWRKQFDSDHPLIVNQRNAPYHEWWNQLDAYEAMFGSGKEFQIDRNMYKEAFDRVINTTLSLSPNRRFTVENSPFVYATFMRFNHTALLPGDKQYIHGVIALVASWVLSKSPFPFIILHIGPCPNLKQRLESIPSHSLKMIEIDDSFVQLPPSMESYDNWRVSFQKLAIFSFTQYEKIVFLDSDTMLVQNVDELFGLPSLAAGRDNCDRCQLFRGMNAGVFLLRPSDEVWHSIMEYTTTKQSCLSKVFKWSDQELLICLFDQRQPMVDNIGKWYQLPLVYNLYINNCGCRDESPQDPLYTKWNDNEVKIVHYTCSGKPWENLNAAGRERSAKPRSCQDRFNGKWLEFWDKGIELLGMDPTSFVDGDSALHLLFSNYGVENHTSQSTSQGE